MKIPVWKTSYPDLSNASTIVVKGGVVLCGEKTRIRCFSLKEGRVLWEKENPYLEKNEKVIV